jgi:hypothetical protein
MKNFFTRFLAIVAILVMAFSCSTVAFTDEDNPYQEYYYELPSIGIVFETEKEPVMSSPSKKGESLGTLECTAVCRILGKYGENWYIIDLTVFEGFEAEYGFVQVKHMVENPRWIMLLNKGLRPKTKEGLWPLSTDSYPFGLQAVLNENDTFYFTLVRGQSKDSRILKETLIQFSKEGQEIYFVPFETPLYDELREEIGVVPGFTIVEIDEDLVSTDETDEDAADDYIPVKVNPGTDDEVSGWIVNQTLPKIIN